jgi:hypothetical protein
MFRMRTAHNRDEPNSIAGRLRRITAYTIIPALSNPRQGDQQWRRHRADPSMRPRSSELKKAGLTVAAAVCHCEQIGVKA